MERFFLSYLEKEYHEIFKVHVSQLCKLILAKSGIRNVKPGWNRRLMRLIMIRGKFLNYTFFTICYIQSKHCAQCLSLILDTSNVWKRETSMMVVLFHRYHCVSGLRSDNCQHLYISHTTTSRWNQLACNERLFSIFVWSLVFFTICGCPLPYFISKNWLFIEIMISCGIYCVLREWSKVTL